MNILSDFRAKNILKYYWLCDEIFANWIVQILKPYGKSILDIGCGNGLLAMGSFSISSSSPTMTPVRHP